MSAIDEALDSQSQIKAALASGLDTLDLNQTVTWTQYRRIVLPIDGFVFWVKADILSPGALINSSVVNSFTPNQATTVIHPAVTFDAQGSLHHTTTNQQSSDESFSVNRMIFTSKTPVNNLNEIAPNILYLATTNGQRYAFSSRRMWYKQAGLYHYSGDAVYPTMETQIIDYPSVLNQRDIVVSNSLPIWLGFNQLFPVFPSFLVPDNLPPPFAAVHIGEEDTIPMQSGATHDLNGTRWQLTKDTVRVTTYGVRNDTIMDWLDFINDYTLSNPGVLGVMNSPIPKDAKQGQVEISTIAQKKVIIFDASYYQARVRTLARKLITESFLEDFLVPQIF